MADNSRTTSNAGQHGEHRDALAGGTGTAFKDRASDIASSAKEKANEFGHTVKEKANDLAGSAGQMYDEARSKVQEWGSDAADAANYVKGRAQEVTKSAIEQGENLGQELTGLVRRYPMQSVLVCLGVGFLAAQATRRI